MELQETREEMSVEELHELDAIQELEASLEQNKQGLMNAAEAAEDAMAEYEIEVMAQQELNKFVSICLSDTRRQAQMIAARGGVVQDWNNDRMWESNVVIPPRLDELSLAQRRAVFKFMLSELHRYKLRVEGVMEKKRHDEMLEERKRSKRGGGGGLGVGGGGGGYGDDVWGDGAGGAGRLEEGVKMKTGIAGWDNHDSNSFLGGILALTQVAERGVKEAECQTEIFGGEEGGSVSDSSTLAPLGGYASRSGSRSKKW